MKRNIEYIQALGKEMSDNDARRNEHYNRIDNMINLQWDLPEQIRKLKWMRKVVSTDPQSALKTGIRTLATVEPIPNYQPTNPNPDTIKRASDIEMNLLWQLRQSDKRSEHRIVPDVVESALRYDICAVQTIPLKWQLGGMEGELPTRLRAAKNLGSFINIIHNPKGIHARFTPLGLDKVLSIKVMKADEAIAFYGKERTLQIQEDIKDEKKEVFVTVFDYWDYNQRTVWAANNGSQFSRQEPTAKDYELIDEEVDMPFLPWTIKKGGTSLESREEFAVRPMLGTIANSDMWETQNIAQSMSFSEMIGLAAAPKYKIRERGPDGEVRVDYGDINKPVRLGLEEDIERLDPPRIDENLLHISDRIQSAMDKDTVAKSLQNLDFPSGTAFATVNAVIKSATAALDPYKSLAEDTISGIFENMLRWTHYTGDELQGYGYHDTDTGNQYSLTKDDIDPEHIYIDVKLSAHVPTDYMQRIEAAIALIQQLDFPKEDAYKTLDVPNADQVMDKRYQERLNEHQLNIKMNEMQSASELKIQQQQMAMQMQAQQAQQQAQQQQQQAQQQDRGAQAQQMRRGMQASRTGAPRREALSRAVQGNPARTGVSPNQSNPQGNTRESRTGRDMGGEELA